MINVVHCIGFLHSFLHWAAVIPTAHCYSVLHSFLQCAACIPTAHGMLCTARCVHSCAARHSLLQHTAFIPLVCGIHSCCTVHSPLQRMAFFATAHCLHSCSRLHARTAWYSHSCSTVHSMLQHAPCMHTACDGHSCSTVHSMLHSFAQHTVFPQHTAFISYIPSHSTLHSVLHPHSNLYPSLHSFSQYCTHPNMCSDSTLHSILHAFPHHTASLLTVGTNVGMDTVCCGDEYMTECSVLNFGKACHDKEGAPGQGGGGQACEAKAQNNQAEHPNATRPTVVTWTFWKKRVTNAGRAGRFRL